MSTARKGVLNNMKFHYVAPMYYLPMQYAASLYNQGYSQAEAARIAIDRFAYYGKKNNKRLKNFSKENFIKSFNKFVKTPGAIIVRKSPRH